jgi:hypothetical protein
MKKDECLQKIRASRQALVAVLESVPEERRTEPGLAGGWSVKDSLVHLTYWEGHLVTMLFQLRAGAPLGTVHFSNRSVDEINADWFEKGKNRAWEMAWSDFNGLAKQIERRISDFDERELNNLRLNPKLDGKPLWEWIANDTFLHEDEHREAIQAWLGRS